MRFWRFRVSFQVRAATIYQIYISSRFNARHMSRSASKNKRRTTFTAGGNEYEELMGEKKKDVSLQPAVQQGHRKHCHKL